MKLSDFIWENIESLVGSWGCYYSDMQIAFSISEDCEIRFIDDITGMSEMLTILDQIKKSILQTTLDIDFDRLRTLDHYVLDDVANIELNSVHEDGKRDVKLVIMLFEKGE